jgi:prepilin-type N-terminal cleavage/methylation domain-containing protein
MGYRTTFTKPSRLHPRRRGFTLAEMLIAMTISILLLGAMCTFAMFNGKSLTTLFNYVDLDQANQRTLDQMTKDFRGILNLTAFSTDTVTLMDNDNKTLTYSFDPAQKTLTRTKSGQSTKLLTDVEWLTFTMEQRNLISGTFDAYTATNIADCKILNASWNCSRSVLGKKDVMQSPQTARIVIRN